MFNFESNTTKSLELKGTRIRVVCENYKKLHNREFIVCWTSTVVNRLGQTKTFYHIAQPDTMFSIFGIAEYYLGESQVELIKE